MLATGGGSIINVSSILGVIGIRDSKIDWIAYSAAKAGVSSLARALAADYAAEGIRVNCIIVGRVDTPIAVATLGEEAREKRRLSVPLQTRGTGWDVGWAALYLASDESRWVTGIDLPIDGELLRIFEQLR
jgi:NAD(P)-dependent dehydrogenase (short-subunit alcohol dehydrogenase family)